MNIADVIKILSKIPPQAIEDAVPIIEESVKVAADVKAFLEKYPQILEAFKGA
jgi:hypothetical protein